MLGFKKNVALFWHFSKYSLPIVRKTSWKATQKQSFNNTVNLLSENVATVANLWLLIIKDTPHSMLVFTELFDFELLQHRIASSYLNNQLSRSPKVACQPPLGPALKCPVAECWVGASQSQKARALGCDFTPEVPPIVLIFSLNLISCHPESSSPCPLFSKPLCHISQPCRSCSALWLGEGWGGETCGLRVTRSI